MKQKKIKKKKKNQASNKSVMGKYHSSSFTLRNGSRDRILLVQEIIARAMHGSFN